LKLNLTLYNNDFLKAITFLKNCSNKKAITVVNFEILPAIFLGYVISHYKCWVKECLDNIAMSDDDKLRCQNIEMADFLPYCFLNIVSNTSEINIPYDGCHRMLVYNKLAPNKKVPILLIYEEQSEYEQFLEDLKNVKKYNYPDSW
jgi:hypothetical protein